MDRSKARFLEYGFQFLDELMLTYDQLKWIGANAPPAKEHAEANRLERSGESADSDGVERAFLGKYLRDELFIDRELVIGTASYVCKAEPIESSKIKKGPYARCKAGREQQAAQVCRAFVAQGASLDD